MSKEKFQRTKPHVNIGLIILILAALVYVYAAGDVSLFLKASGTDIEGESEFGPVEANWVWVQQDCETQIAALNVKYTLFTPDGTPASPSGTESLLLLALFTPPDTPDDFASAGLQPVAAAGIRFIQELEYLKQEKEMTAGDIIGGLHSYSIMMGLDGNLWVESPGGGFQQASVDNHPDFAWLPTYNPAQAKSSLYFPEDMFTEIKSDKSEMYLLLILLPEAPDIAGLFKDTAEGESGDAPAFVGDTLLRILEIQPGTSADSPAVYNFSLNGDVGLVIFNPFEFGIKKPTGQANGGALMLLPYIDQPSSIDLGGAVADIQSGAEPIPAAGTWVSVDGMSLESEIIEHKSGGLICTPTPSSTPSPTPSGTPTSTRASGGGVSAPSPTLEPPSPTDVPWNPTPTSGAPSPSPTREPPRPTDTPREPTPTRGSGG